MWAGLYLWVCQICKGEIKGCGQNCVWVCQIYQSKNNRCGQDCIYGFARHVRVKTKCGQDQAHSLDTVDIEVEREDVGTIKYTR